jgi:activating signal cointegrator 1
MLCLSLWQPWASLLAHGIKKIETRSWQPRVRLPFTLAVHAAKKWTQALADLCNTEPFASALRTIGPPDDLWRGCVVGVVRVVNVCDTVGLAFSHGSYPSAADDTERAFGDYSPGRFGWVCDTFRPLKTPIPCRGMQGMFALPDEVLSAVNAQLESDRDDAALAREIARIDPLSDVDDQHEP